MAEAEEALMDSMVVPSRYWGRVARDTFSDGRCKASSLFENRIGCETTASSLRGTIDLG